jgi:hypothetical protein
MHLCRAALPSRRAARVLPGASYVEMEIMDNDRMAQLDRQDERLEELRRYL